MLTFLILAVAAVMLASCSGGERGSGGNDDGSRKLRIVTTIFPQYDFTRQIAGDLADVKMLLKPGEEIHSFEPTPRDIRDIQSCDLFIYVGGENDEWVEDILDSMGDDRPDTLKLMDCVDLLDEEAVEGMQTERGHEHEHEADEHEHEADEHVWTSPRNAIKITERISELLCEKDPEHADIYRSNTAAYTAELKDLDNSFRELTADAPRRTIVFGDRFPLLYFANEYGLEYFAAFSGCSADNEVSAKTIVFLTEIVRDEDIPVVFCLELSNGKIADSICEVTGAEKLTFYACHNVTAKQLEEGVTYISMMKENLKSLRTALCE